MDLEGVVMEEKLNELRSKAFLELQSFGMTGYKRGKSGIIITDDKKVYYYHSYFNGPSVSLENAMDDYISEGKDFDEAKYLELVNYINEYIIGKDFEEINVRDGGCFVFGKGFNSVNHVNIYNDIKKIIGEEYE